jgi:alanine dehydrogenase
VFATADMIVKVKEPQPVEIKRLRPARPCSPICIWRPIPEQTKGLIESAPSHRL